MTAGTDDPLRDASALREAGRHADALAAYRALVAARPDDPHAHQHLAGLLVELARAAEAEPFARRALALDPVAATNRFTLALILLEQGRFREAMRPYEARFALYGDAAVPKRFPFPRWRGEPLTGRRLAVFPEQGLGDQLFFARFMPVLRDQGIAVTWLAPPPLARLFGEAFGEGQVVPASGAVDFPDPDAWCLSSEDGGGAGATATMRPSAPYLPLPAAASDGGFRVGLMTAGNPAFVRDASRSLPADMAERLAAALPGTVVPLDPRLSGAADFRDTAEIVAGLDLVVTVNTAVAHLAGALGVPGIVLMRRFACDWRWLPESERSPWYPSLRIVRNDWNGDWTRAVDEAADAAHAAAAQR